jgi:exopolyphosphatase/pppGpp-phosphohydrolase
MSIDGIGKPPGGAGPLGGSGAPVPVRGESFSIGASPAVDETGGSAELTSLSRGEITLNEYLDVRVNEAVQPFESKLAPDQLEFVREALREQLASDPALIELARRATGTLPTE